ncbi:MAG: DUF2933 domain-containing protein [Thermodesulfobacteriota bacterium]
MGRSTDTGSMKKAGQGAGFLILAVMALGAIFLFPELRAWLGRAGFFLVFLLCPLLHVFLHRGHGGHGGHQGHDTEVVPRAGRGRQDEVGDD